MGAIIVFYDKGSYSDGWRYLEAAPQDTSDRIQWYTNWRDHPNIGTGTAIGTGRANTDAILADPGSGKCAAQVCRDLTTGGFHDWFLPSKDELNLLYNSLARKGLGLFASEHYWSSSRNKNLNSSAEFQWFGEPGQAFGWTGSMDNWYRVRAVRTF